MVSGSGPGPLWGALEVPGAPGEPPSGSAYGSSQFFFGAKCRVFFKKPRQCFPGLFLTNPEVKTREGQMMNCFLQ